MEIRKFEMTMPDLYRFYISNRHYLHMEPIKMSKITSRLKIYYEMKGDLVKINVLERVKREMKEKRNQMIIDHPWWAMYYNCVAEYDQQNGNGKPESLSEVEKYFDNKNVNNPREMAYCFYQVMESTGWKTKGGNPLKQWKLSAKKWLNTVKRSDRRRREAVIA